VGAGLVVVTTGRGVVGAGHRGSLGFPWQFGGQRGSVDPGTHENRVVVGAGLVVVTTRCVVVTGGK
jgi:hypothetical protein